MSRPVAIIIQVDGSGVATALMTARSPSANPLGSSIVALKL